MALAYLNAPCVALVVEDEPLLRLNAVELLQSDDFVVIEACDADAAIALLVTRLDIRLVFTDIDMPGSMDGLRLAAAIRSRWPPIEIIITSGKTLPRSDDCPARSVFLRKPYRDEALLDAAHAFFP